MAKLINLPGTRPANEGETLVISYLTEKLPGTYTLIPNAEIPQPGSPPFEMDLIVIAPHAVYVVEIKRWLGGIQGDDYYWMVSGMHRRPNPWTTVNNKARVLKSKIERFQPNLRNIWVDAVVAIADEQGQLNLRGNCRERVFRYTDLPAFLTNSEILGERALDLKQYRTYIETTLQEAARGRRIGPLQYGSYRVEETLLRRDQVSEFLASNNLLPASPKVRLRVFSYNPYLPDEERALHQARLRREAEALMQIGNHPNLIGLKSFDAAPEDPNLLIEVTDWSEGGTLRSLMNSETPLTLDRKLELAIGISSGLQAAHSRGVIHRDLRPENVLIGADGTPRLMNFDHARIETPSAQTVSPRAVEPGISRAYIAPELDMGITTAAPTADLYSLGMILFEMLVGQTLYDSPEQARQSTSPKNGPTDFVTDVPPELDTLIRSLLKIKPEGRPQNALEVLDRLRSIREKPSTNAAPVESLPPSKPVIPSEPSVFALQDLIDGKFQVQKVMGEGGSGRVYRVYDSVFDRVFALKVYEGTNLAMDSLQQEARALLNLNHPNIVRVVNWGRLPSGRVYLVSDFVEGEVLSHYTVPEHRLTIRESVQIIADLLDALAYLHPDIDLIESLREDLSTREATEEEFKKLEDLKSNGWLHRDIKPSNLILSPQGVRLIDFNIATRANTAGQTFVGTKGYMLPSVGFARWSTEHDLFATGIVLYQLITGHYPYQNDLEPGSSPVIDPREFVPELSPAFSELLMRAVSCEQGEHYSSARHFRQDLLAFENNYLLARPLATSQINLTLDQDEIGRPNYNPYVTRLLKLYSQARRDNSGTRGLNEIAQLTYVPTRLDRSLQPAILNGQYRLVIITGNAGDGKTAFIQNLEKVAKDIQRPSANSSIFQYHGLTFRTNYDGSQDEGADRANDQVLSEFFAPFSDANFSSVADQSNISIIAINEGRLVDFFSPLWSRNANTSSQVQSFQHLADCIKQYFENNDSAAGFPSWLLIVDINQRSMVALDAEEKNLSIFDRQLQALLKPEFWQSCQECALKEACFIKYNVDTLADPISGPAVHERIRTLFEIVHLRRLLHITMRDLRSALSWLLLRDHSCDEVAAELSSNSSPEARLGNLYHNAFQQNGKPRSGQGEDRLIALLRQIDPALTANPRTDRALHFSNRLPMLSFENRSSLTTDLFNSWTVPGGWQGDQMSAGKEQRVRHNFLRRMAFFERRDQDWKEMLPYRNLHEFQSITDPSKSTDLAQLRESIGRGFSYVEGAKQPQLTKQFVCIRAGQPVKTSLRSFRTFPLKDFEIGLPEFKTGDYLEHTMDHFVFKHVQKISSAQAANLSVSLDLLELLEEINKGYIPSPDDISGIFVNLLTFRNSLAHLPYDQVVLTRDDRRFFQIYQTQDKVLHLSVYEPEDGEKS